MSILLEALRKSEKSQRPAEAPDIRVEQQVGVDFHPLRKGPFALLLLLALLLITWLVWRQYQLPVVGYQPPVTLPAKRGGAVDAPVSTVQTTKSTANSDRGVKRASKEQRTPVETFQQEATVKPKAKPKTKPKANQPKPKPKGKQTGKQTGKTKTTLAKKRAGKDRVKDKNPAPISYWELPDAVRANVAEIRFSVLVYASQPADRFVLVNGQRLQEGDSYQQGLVVEEIRRDGVVFSFRLYRFLVER